MEITKIPELLAPAGSWEALKAAVNAGADAVYLSGKSFGARYYAGNFDEAQMKEAMEYAHVRGVNVYITVNTLVKDGELEEVADYLFWLYQMGADAVILQDVGVASLCRELFPDMDMHASTQMTINSVEGVKWAYDFGFKRVVLARELNLAEIENMVQVMGGRVELEIFAHGALCYSYSGQCLLSSVIGGRSGNRGRCAQPCRKPYTLLKGDKDEFGKLAHPVPLMGAQKYLLSTRDLALYNHLDKVSPLGLDSLKIEGRMRSPEYVAIVVSIYRKALNALKQGQWVPDKRDLYKLKLAFNREFTRGYLLDKDKKSLMGRESPGNRGLYLGRVLDSKYHGKNKEINLKLDISNFKLDKGDGIVFIHPEKSKYGTVIEEEPVSINKDHILLKVKKRVKTGSEVYLTRDVSLLDEARDILREDRKGLPIPLNISMYLDNENRPVLTGEFTGLNKQNYKVKYRANFKMETAIKRPLSREQIINQLQKTGGTPFKINNLEANYSGNLFAPLSKINQIRRELVNEAELAILNDYKPAEGLVESIRNRLDNFKKDLKLNRSSKKNKPLKNPLPEIAVYSNGVDTVKGALTGGCQRIYFEPLLRKNHPETTCKITDWKNYSEGIQKLILDAQKLCKEEDAVLVWKWPSITTDDFLVNFQSLVKYLFNKEIKEIMVDNVGSLKTLKNLDIPLQICGSAGLNIWNHCTVDEFSRALNRITLSNELSREELMDILAQSRKTNQNISFDLVVQGNLESVISEDCLLKEMGDINYKDAFWGIEDITERIFPINLDDEGRTHISNSVELCLIDHLPDLCQMGFENLIIDARNKTGKYAKNIVEIYSQGLKLMEKKPGKLLNLNNLKIKVKKLSQGGITTGNYIKGLKEG